MLHAAAMLAGLFFLAFIFTSPVLGANAVFAAVAIALAAAAFGLRFGGASRAFSGVLASIGFAPAAARRALGGALKTVRLAAAADISLHPALIRIRAARAGPFEQVRIAAAAGGAAGAIVVECDSEGLLVHANDEEGVEVKEFERIEARIGRAQNAREAT